MSGAPLPGLGWEGPDDPVDRIILNELTALPGLAGPLVVLDDATGDLTPGAAKAVRGGGEVRVHCDDLSAEQRVAAAGFPLSALSPELFTDARLVVMRLPRSLAALQEYAELIAANAHRGVRVVAGGRVKHMTTSMNEVLVGSFDHVWASLGRQKSRVLHASGPRPVTPEWPRTATVTVPEAGGRTALALRSHGAAFATGRLDDGTALLLSALADTNWRGRRVLDLGCGTGILACWLALRGAGVDAIDISAAAVRSARATAQANGVAAADPTAVPDRTAGADSGTSPIDTPGRVVVHRTADLAHVPAASLDAVVCNPPFHKGAAKDSTPAFTMIEDAARTLRPGGELWLVFNSHLPYLRALRRRVGRTDIVTRNRHYTVTRSIRAQLMPRPARQR